jgi:cell division protein FtsB
MESERFGQLGQEIFKQKQLMDRLEAENRELRRLIADLRAGRGVSVVISGNHFALRENPSPRDHVTRF